MNRYNQPAGMPAGSMDMALDQGLRSFMLGVYNKLALGIALAGVLAYVAGTVEPVTQLLYGTPLIYVVMFGPMALIIGSMVFARNPSPGLSAFFYWAIVVMLGLSMSVYVMMATSGANGLSYGVIAKAFLSTAITFAGLSLYGYTTKRDLGPIGTFAVMAIWGLVVVGVLTALFAAFSDSFGGIAFGSSLDLMFSGGFALLSAVIIAWQTQELKEGYYAFNGDERQLAVMTNWGALNFFITFVNIFQFFLRLFAND